MEFRISGYFEIRPKGRFGGGAPWTCRCCFIGLCSGPAGWLKKGEGGPI